MRNFIKKHKLFVSTLFTVAVITAVLGVQFGVVPENGNQTVGQGSIVLKIGTVEASGTVDYVCDGTDDNIQLQGALDALPANGGKIEILAGNYDLANGTTVTRVLNNVTIAGTGRGTYITCDGATAIFTAGGNNWTISNLRTDAGGITMGATTGWIWQNVTVNATYYTLRTSADGNLTIGTATATTLNAPTGRTATYVVAASDAPAHVKAQADYVCDGTADDVQIQAAIDALPAAIPVYGGGHIQGGGTVQLSEGRFNISSPIEIKRPAMTLRGVGTPSTVLRLSDNANCNVIHFDMSTVPDGLYEVTIENMQLDGNIPGNISGNGIVFEGARACFFRNLYIQQFEGYGFYANGAIGAVDYANFEDCYVVCCQLGGWKTIGFAGQLQLTNCYVLLVATGNVGFSFTSGSSITMTDCTYDGGSPGVGFAIMLDHCTNVKISKAMIYGVQAGLSAIQIMNITDNAFVSRGIYIEGCEIQSTAIGDTCFAFYIYGRNLQDIQILNNRVSGKINQPIIFSSWMANSAISKVLIGNNIFVTTAVATSALVTSDIILTNYVFQNNIGYIASGEVRTASGSLTGGAANAILFAWHNPEAQDIFIKKVVINIITGDADAANIDCGIADDATYTNGGTEFFNDLPGETIAVDDSWVVGDGGTQTKWVHCQDSASATDGWVVAKILTNDGTSIVGSWYIEYCGKYNE